MVAMNVSGSIGLNGLPVQPTIAPSTVASLPSSAISQGFRGMATDSTVSLSAGIGNIVVGGGANIVPV